MVMEVVGLVVVVSGSNAVGGNDDGGRGGIADPHFLLVRRMPHFHTASYAHVILNVLAIPVSLNLDEALTEPEFLQISMIYWNCFKN